MNLSRRSFLKSTLAAFSLPLVPGCVSLFGDGNPLSRLGVCSWSFRLPLDQVAVELKKLGLSRVHLALGPFIEGDARHGSRETAAGFEKVLARVHSGEWKVSCGMVGFKGEDYSTLESIRRTGGIVPDQNWKYNQDIVKEGVRLTAQLKSPYLTCHAGFLDISDKKAFRSYHDRVQFMADLCGEHNVMLLLETGQEVAPHMAELLSTVSNVGVNLDPANMILYAKGKPVEAVKTLAPWIRHVHLKDAVQTKVPGTWGNEVPWGDGEVNAQLFLKTLKEVGFKGNFAIEREGGNNRIGDIALAVRRYAAEMAEC